MVIHYQNTFEEFAEASKLIAARQRKRRRARQQWLAAFMVVFFLAAISFYESVAGIDQFTVLFHIISPIFFSFILVALVLCAASIVAGKMPRVSLRAALSAAIILVGIISVIVLFRISRTANPGSPGFVWGWAVFLPHTTWMFFVLWLTIATIRSQRTRVRRLWDDQMSLHRAKTADISAEGVVVTDVVSRVEVRWNGFVGWEETKTLFVMFLSGHQALFIPKSAFASAEELEAMRALARFIPTTTAAAFQVIQAGDNSAAPPPLPVK